MLHNHYYFNIFHKSLAWWASLGLWLYKHLNKAYAGALKEVQELICISSL